MGIPPTGIPGTEHLYELRLDVEGLDPCIDLMANGTVLATVFYDTREIGWCLEFSDDSGLMRFSSRMPPSGEEHILAAAWVKLADRIDERGLWDPGPEFRLWGRPDDPDEE